MDCNPTRRVLAHVNVKPMPKQEFLLLPEKNGDYADHMQHFNFRLWASLFQEGPVGLELTGGFEWVERDNPASGKYAKITMPRDSVVKTTNEIAALAEAATSGQYYVLHLGI